MNGAVARIGEFEGQAALMARDLEHAKPRVEIAESAAARALGSRAQHDIYSCQLLTAASQDTTLLKASAARVKEPVSDIESRTEGDSTRC